MPRRRSERIGFIVSAGMHLGAILWLLVGGIFFSHDLPATSVTTEVSFTFADPCGLDSVECAGEE